VPKVFVMSKLCVESKLRFENNRIRDVCLDTTC